MYLSCVVPAEKRYICSKPDCFVVLPTYFAYRKHKALHHREQSRGAREEHASDEDSESSGFLSEEDDGDSSSRRGDSVESESVHIDVYSDGMFDAEVDAQESGSGLLNLCVPCDAENGTDLLTLTETLAYAHTPVDDDDYLLSGHNRDVELPYEILNYSSISYNPLRSAPEKNGFK